ncbi:lasso peptide biosynthesis B2 protein [Streptomyces sp. G45]|uniref:lasso peptide biosynthesis B2 protein n=1 Tax=Streptomyces sp. G45 TaxID=3406627 RepID=UPI003C1A242D
MTLPEAMPHDPRSVPLASRAATRGAVALARLLATQPPGRIRVVLARLRRGARPATVGEAEAARSTVVAVSLACAGQRGCLPRSLATVLLCRMRGQWPTWCVGVRTRAPFAAHAWVEAEGVLVGEGCPRDYYQRFFTVE